MAPRSLALAIAAVVCGTATACSSDGGAGAESHDAGRDATVTLADAGVDAGDSRADGAPDGAEDVSDDEGSSGDDAGDGGADATSGEENWILPPLPWDACAVFDASALDEASVAAGLAALEYYDCPICHEQRLVRDDAGNIILHLDGNRLAPGVYAPNLTNSPDGLGCWSNAEIVRAILFGIDPEGGTLCPPMPVWSRIGMDAGTAAMIVDYLRSLPPSETLVREMTCAPMDLDAGLAAEANADGGD